MRKLLLSGLICAASLGLSCDSKPSKPNETPVVLVEKKTEPDEPTQAEPKSPAVDPKAPAVQPGAIGEFRFSDDSAGRALAELLTPRSANTINDSFRRNPLDRQLPEAISNPSMMSKLGDLQPARLPEPKSSIVLPRALPDRIPNDLGGLTLSLPPKPEFPTGVLTKIDPLFDPATPVPLPILARPIPDRAPLDDPTVPFTQRSVIRETIPLREDPAGFMKFTLPDPFELSETIRLRTPLKEGIDSMPTPLTVPKGK
jgi:hypothetical protein